MSFDRQSGIVIFECDACPETFDSQSRDFFEAKDLLMREGWLIRKKGSEWFHLCPQHKNVDLDRPAVDNDWLTKLTDPPDP